MCEESETFTSSPATQETTPSSTHAVKLIEHTDQYMPAIKTMHPAYTLVFSVHTQTIAMGLTSSNKLNFVNKHLYSTGQYRNTSLMAHMWLILATLLALAPRGITPLELQNWYADTQLGTLIKHLGPLDASVSKADIVIQIPHIILPTPPSDPEFCTSNLTRVVIRSKEPQDIKDYKMDLARLIHRTCRKFGTLRTRYYNLHDITRSHILDLKQTMVQLDLHDYTTELAQSQRSSRSLAGFLSFLGIASANRQKHLALHINKIEQNQGVMWNQLQNLTQVSQVHSEIITDIYQVLRNFTDHINAVSIRTVTLANSINRLQMDVALTKKLLLNLADWMLDLHHTCNLYMHTLHGLNVIMSQRVSALRSSLNQQLSPTLVPPRELEPLLAQLTFNIQHTYPEFRLTNQYLAHYYRQQNTLTSITESGIYISIPIAISSLDNIFQLHQIETFKVPTRTQDGSQLLTQIQPEYNVIGVSRDRNRYIVLTQSDFNSLCEDHDVFLCKMLLVQYKSKIMPSCSYGLYSKNVTMITEYCKTVITNTFTATDVQARQLSHNRILLVTPPHIRWYLDCSSQEVPEVITLQEVNIITLACNCLLYADNINLPRIIHPDCLAQKRNITILNEYNMNLLALSMFQQDEGTLADLDTAIPATQNPLPPLPPGISKVVLSPDKLKQLKNRLRDFNDPYTALKNPWMMDLVEVKAHMPVNKISRILGYSTIAIVVVITVIIVILATKTKLLHAAVAKVGNAFSELIVNYPRIDNVV